MTERHLQKIHRWLTPLMNQRGTLTGGAPVPWAIIYAAACWELGGIFGQPPADSILYSLFGPAAGIYGYRIVVAIAGFIIGFLSETIYSALSQIKWEIQFLTGIAASLLLVPIYFFVSAHNRVWYLIALCLVRGAVVIIERKQNKK